MLDEHPLREPVTRKLFLVTAISGSAAGLVGLREIYYADYSSGIALVIAAVAMHYCARKLFYALDAYERDHERWEEP